MNRKDLYLVLLQELHGRVNVMTRQTVEGQMVVIYDDHRWLLNVLFAANKHIERPNLITFDAHDDADQCAKKTELLKQIGVEDLKNATAKQFGAFVDYDQRPDDGGWLTTAMELNLIDSVVNIGNRHGHNFEDMNGIYESEDGVEHNVFEMSQDLEHELGSRGKLGDTCREGECRALRDLFGIEYFYTYAHCMEIEEPYVLDFDLDFFTMSSNDEPTHGWTERVLNRHFPVNSEQDKFLRRLIRDAHIITICREPDYCGSLGDSNRLLSFLDRYYFEGQLGTDVTL